jgi:glycosyltransferase involved in cell wall biosynthesis
MRVLLTHDRFPPVFGGGGEYVVLETARGLLRSGVDLKVLVGGDPAITSYEGIATTRVPVSPRRFAFSVPAIRKHARDVDLIQAFTYYAAPPSLLAGRLTGKPVVVYVLGIYGDTWRQMRPPFEARVRIAWEKFLLRGNYAHIIVPSHPTRDLAISLGADGRKISVNHPGISDELRPLPKQDYVFFSGKNDRRKGTEDLLAAARALPHVRFRAMIWGPDLESFQRAAPPNIEFPPFERGEPLRREFGVARIFFFPSVSETFSIALSEAMATGCAIVASESAAADVSFEGARVRPGNREDMIAGIDRLWKDPALCSAAGAANANFAANFGWDAYIGRLRAVYDSVLDRRAAVENQPARPTPVRGRIYNPGDKC